MRRRLLVASAASATVILAAPFIGQLRAALQRAVPGQFRLLVAVAVLGAVGVATLIALVRIRNGRKSRYAAIALAILFGLVYARVSGTGNPDVDVVERFHFVEYGLIALLFYRVWRTRGDIAVLFAPLLAAMLTATLDEWLQWFIPIRVGEMHDVLLDGAAVACGLLFSLGLDPPARLVPGLLAGTWRAAAICCTIVIVTGALFVDTVHIGYEIDDGLNVFRSRYTAADLDEAARDRTLRWRESPPIELHRLSREDQYLSEGLWHVQRRNQGPDVVRAWRENAILERFFAPVLDTPSYVTPAPSRWAPEQRADAEAKARAAGADGLAYISDAEPAPIYAWSQAAYWAIVAVIVLAAAAVCRLLERSGATTVTAVS